MTLTRAATVTKKFLFFSAVIFIVGISSWLSYYYYIHYIYPSFVLPAEDKPDIAFGQLTKPFEIQPNASTSNYTYTLNTTTGRLPDNLPKLMRVYFSRKMYTTLLALDRAKNLADILDFKNGPEVISPIEYKFNDGADGELVIDLSSGNFRFERNTTSEDTLQLKTVEAQNKYTKDFREYLQKRGLINAQLQDGRMGLEFESTEAKTAIVSIWPNNLGEYGIVFPRFNSGLIKTQVIAKDQAEERYKTLDYIFWPIDENITGTYPIKPVEQAFNELKEGKGVVALEPKGPQVSLTSAYLAYYESEDYSPHIQPVYVFEGQNFAAYVTAVTDEFLVNSEPEKPI